MSACFVCLSESIMANPQFNRTAIIQKYEMGFSSSEIARDVGCSYATVYNIVKKQQSFTQSLDDFRQDRPFYLSKVQKLALERKLEILEDDRLWSKLKPMEKVNAIKTLNIVVGTMYDKERLELGLSTANQSSVVKFIESCHDDLFTEAELHAGDPAKARTLSQDAPRRTLDVTPHPPKGKDVGSNATEEDREKALVIASKIREEYWGSKA